MYFLSNLTFFFIQGRFYLKNRQKPTATLIYTDNIIYNISTIYIPPPPIINTFFDVKILRKYMFIKVANDESSSTYVRWLMMINARVQEFSRNVNYIM